MTDWLTTRYASQEISELFTPLYRARLWRKLWIALAKAQKKAGLSITDEQIAELEDHPEPDLSRIAALEAETGHDVLAHIASYAEECPKAKPIIHLGATSAFVQDNADLIIMRQAQQILASKLGKATEELAEFAYQHRALACTGWTHFQPAQPTTLGKRAALWLQDFLEDLKRLQDVVPFRGARGATGTQSSYLLLLADPDKVEEMERELCQLMGMPKTFALTSQTYPRKFDSQILDALAGVAQSASKFATDIRLLAHLGELNEPQRVGSSAMPHKNNPVISERICGLARYLIVLRNNTAHTAATQWLERSLDDSSNRRLVLSGAFLTADAILESLFIPQVNPEKIAANLNAHRADLSKEVALMRGVKEGEDRQELHAKLQKISVSKADDQTLIGLAARQTEEFLKAVRG